MAYADKVRADGILRDIHDTAARGMIAPTEASSTASAAHAKGSYFIYGDALYQATSGIAAGGTITPGTNCQTVPGGLGVDLSDLKSAVEDNNAWDLMITAPRKTDETVGGVTYTWDTAKEVCSLSGKRTAASYCVVFPNNSGLNGFEKGHT